MITNYSTSYNKVSVEDHINFIRYKAECKNIKAIISTIAVWVALILFATVILKSSGLPDMTGYLFLKFIISLYVSIRCAMEIVSNNEIMDQEIKYAFYGVCNIEPEFSQIENKKDTVSHFTKHAKNKISSTEKKGENE